MLTRSEIVSKTNEQLQEYIDSTVKPTIKLWQGERKRIDWIIRNRK
jgi:hypothetical protein